MIEQYSTPQPGKNELLSRFQNPADSCEHRFEVRRMSCSNGTTQFRKQCIQCGKGLSAISVKTLSRRERNKAPEFDRGLQDVVRETAWNRWKTSTEYDQQDRWLAWYNGYLASSVWRRRRAVVLARSLGICESCRKLRATDAHHLTYKHVGAEPLFELVAVCPSCHRQIHEQETP